MLHKRISIISPSIQYLRVIQKINVIELKITLSVLYRGWSMPKLILRTLNVMEGGFFSNENYNEI